MAIRRFTFAKIDEITALEANPAWLAACAVAVLLATIVWRVIYAAEIPAECGAELEAARRIIGGALPYTQFYSSDLLPLFGFRLATLLLLPLTTLLVGHGHGSALSAALFDLDSNFCDAKSLGLASVLATTTAMLISAIFLHRILSIYVKASHQWLLLLAFALANLCMGFEFGQQQHVFVLMALPYLTLRYCQWQYPDKKCPLTGQIISAFAAAFGAGFSLFNFAALVFFELGEILARRSLKSLITASSLYYCGFSIFIWASLLGLGASQKGELFGWILPLKYQACTHYNYAYYGWMATPERSDLLYIFVMVAIVAYGSALRFTVLRPLLIMASAGLCTWMFFITGLSCDGLILTFFITLLAVFESYGLVLYMVRSYPRLFALFSRLPLPREQRAASAIVLVAVVALAAYLMRVESQQRRQVKTLAMRLQPPGVHDMQDLESTFALNCKKGDRIMIINGNLRPAYPIITKLGLKSTGYFIGTEPLGFLSSLRNNPLVLPDSKQADFITRTEKRLYKRLLDDVIKDKPKMLCIEGGESEQTLERYGVYASLLKIYQRQCEAMYFSEKHEPRELAEYNYNYWVYKLP